MSNCTVTMDVMERNAEFVQMMYEDEAYESLMQLVGTPRNAMHQQLWDLLWDYVMDSGGLSSWGADPKEQITDWGNFFTHRHFNVINAKTIFIGPYRIPSLIKTVKEVIAKRNKIIKKGKVGWVEKALSPPSLLAMKVDRFGIMDKVIRKAKTITDNTRQAYAKWSSDLDKINETVGNEILQDIDNGIVTVSNSSYDGIKGFKTTLGEDVILIGETADGFEVVYVMDADGKHNIPPSGLVPRHKKKLIRKDSLRASRGDINDALVNKLREGVVNDLMHGQLRYIVRKHIPQQGTQQFDAWLTSFDGKRILKHIEHYKKSREEKPGYNYPYYFKTVEDRDGREWVYVMIKNGEGEVQHELYNTYIIGYNSPSESGDSMVFHSNIYDSQIQAESEAQPHVLTDGWYRSNNIRTKMERINDDGEIIKGSKYKEYDDFELYENPPPIAIVDSLMKKVGELRNINKQVYDKAESMIERNRAKSEEMDDRLRKYYGTKINPDTNVVYTEEEIGAKILELSGTIDIQSFIMNTPDGIVTLNSRLQKKNENYSPIMWDDEPFFLMLDRAKKAIHERLNAIDRSDTIGEDMWIQNMTNLQYLIRISYLSTGNLTEQDWLEDEATLLQELEIAKPGSIGRLKEGGIAVHTKHRVSWTNPIVRRKDDSVMGDYFDKTFRAIHQNELVNELKSAHIKNLESGEPLDSSAMNYINNRVKKSIGDPSVEAGIGNIKYGYEDMANWLNGLPKWIRRRRHWRPEDAEKLVLRVNGVMTSRFLGSSGALHNRTQVVNNIIHYGLAVWWDAKREMKNPIWKERIANTGVENLLSMFNDIMLQGGESDPYEFAFLPGTESLLGMPIPSHNMKQFIKLLRAGRESFVDSGDSKIDAVLMKLIYKEKGEKLKGQMVGLQDYDKRRAYWMAEGRTVDLDALSQQELELLKEKRTAYIDIFLAKQGEQTEKIMKARFEKLLGKISDAKLKKMVTWKLTWWWGGKTGKELFTFTEGEQYMRRLTAIMALRQAKTMGLLPQMEDGSDIYMSPAAVKIARDAVYQSMFGMSTVYMGDAFDGAGRGFMQYKAYPLQQMIHDYEVWKAFNNANRHIGHGDMARRLIQAHWSVLKQMGWRMKGEKDLGAYNPKDEHLDHESIAMLRLLYTRVMATGIATMIGLVPFMGSAFRMSGFSSGLGALRSAENPAVAITFRLLVWGLLMGMGADDDELEKRGFDISSRFAMLLIPVIIGSFIRDGIRGYQYWSEVLD